MSNYQELRSYLGPLPGCGCLRCKKGTELFVELDRLRRDAQELAKLVGCLEPSEEGEPSCDPLCIACRNVAKTVAAKET